MPWQRFELIMKKIVIVFLILLNFKNLYSQGKIEVVVDSQLYEIQSQRLKNKKIADSKPDTLVVQGYRLQVFFSNDRKKALKIKDKLIKEFPEYANEVYLLYQSPNYKVRIGNFVKETDAKPLERRLLKHFDNVFIVRDKIVYIKNKISKEPED